MLRPADVLNRQPGDLEPPHASLSEELQQYTITRSSTRRKNPPQFLWVQMELTVPRAFGGIPSSFRRSSLTTHP
jgi:hypothetical protein